MTAASTALYILYLLYAPYEEQPNALLSGRGGNSLPSAQQGLYSLESLEMNFDMNSEEHARNVGIRHGYFAKAGEFPSQVLIRDEHDEDFTCGGFLVNEYYFVTSANCVYSKFVNGNDFKHFYVVSGSIYRTHGGKKHYFADVKIHPKFTEHEKYYDIAVVKVAEPFKYGRYVQPAKFADSSFDVPVGSETVVVGWGNEKEKEKMSDQLKKAFVTVADHEECKKTYYHRRSYKIVDSQLCAIGKDQGQCEGDYGGPLFYKDVVVGIASFTETCGDYYAPEVYTKVSDFYEWIKSHIVY